MNPLAEQLRRLKSQGVEWESAWLFATRGNRKAYFFPTDRDDGTAHPCGDRAGKPHRCGQRHQETLARFQYRTARLAYLDAGPVPQLDREAIPA